MKRESDIKAPDGYVVAGLRKIRKGGRFRFNGCYWQVPVDRLEEFRGQTVWIHEGRHFRCEAPSVEAAPPGLHIYEAQTSVRTVTCLSAARDDDYEVCVSCGNDTHRQEAACLHCGKLKSWAKDLICATATEGE